MLSSKDIIKAHKSLERCGCEYPTGLRPLFIGEVWC